MDSTGFPFPNSYFTIRPSPKSPKKLFLAISLFTSNSFGPHRSLYHHQSMDDNTDDWWWYDNDLLHFSFSPPHPFPLPSPPISLSFFIIFWVSIDDKNRKKDGGHLGSEHPYIGGRRPLFITFSLNLDHFACVIRYKNKLQIFSHHFATLFSKFNTEEKTWACIRQIGPSWPQIVSFPYRTTFTLSSAGKYAALLKLWLK